MKKNANTAAAATSSMWATLGCAVILSIPPQSADKPYWGVRVQNDRGERYSRTYRCPDMENAQALAAQIALDRKIEVKVLAAPERPVIHPPANA